MKEKGGGRLGLDFAFALKDFADELSFGHKKKNQGAFQVLAPSISAAFMEMVKTGVDLSVPGCRQA